MPSTPHDAALIPAGVLTSNILSVFDSASEDERYAGCQWYATARSTIRAHAAAYGVGFMEACLATAVVSPNLRWESNVRAGIRTLFDLPSAGYRQNRDKARTILLDPDWAGDLSALHCQYFQGAPKTWAFFLLLSGLDLDAVCIDGHAYGIAVGQTLRMKDVPGLTSCDRYEIVADAYRDAAALRGVEPHQMQAVTWTAKRTGRSLAQLPLFA